VISVPHGVRRSFLAPRFVLTLVPLATDPLYPALRFHIKHGLRRTRVLDRHGRIWSRVALQPQVYLDLPAGAVDTVSLDFAVTRKVIEADDAAGTPNSWDSMF